MISIANFLISTIRFFKFLIIIILFFKCWYLISSYKESLIKNRASTEALNRSKQVEQDIQGQIIAEEQDMQGQIIAGQEDLKINIHQLKDGYQNTLDNTINDLVLSIATLTASQKLAHYQATEETPKYFNDVLNSSCEILSTIFKQADALDITSDTPPRLVTLPWHDRRWTPSRTDENSYSPQTDGLAPEMLRIGNLLRMGTFSLEQFRPEAAIPAFVPIRCLSPSLSSKMPGHIVIFSNDAKSRQAAVSAIESIALRLISTFPVRKLQCIFIDPVSMGNSFPFKSLPKHIVGQQTYTRTDDVREQLRKLTVHTEQIIQNYLSRYYQSIEEYNAVNSAVEEAYRYLFIADFPTNFDSTSWEDLKSLLLNGSKAGVYGIIHIDETLEKPRNFNYNIILGGR